MEILIPIIIGFFAGGLSGLIGIGGGGILIPALVLGYGLQQHMAQGISLMVIIPTAISGLITFHRKGLVNYRMAGLLALGSVVGAFCSASYVQYIPAMMLKKIFGVFLTLIGLQMFCTRSKMIVQKTTVKENDI